MINVGIVGCGKIFDRHAEAIAQVQDVCLKAACDTNQERLGEAQKKYGIEKKYTDYHAMISDPDLDLIVICTPSGLHAAMSMAALEASKNVLCEKPIAMNVAEAKEVNALARRKNKNLWEVKQNRYAPAIQILKQMIEEGRLGKLLIGNATVRWNRTQEYYKQASWFGTLAMDGGVVLNQAIHHIDLLTWTMGPAKSVVAKTMVLNHDIEAPDTALAIVQFKNGALGNLELTTCAAPTNIEGSVTIMGDKGTIKVGGKSLDIFEIWNVEGYDRPEIPKSRSSNHALIYQDILKEVSGDKKKSLVTGEEAVKSLLLAEGIFLSSQFNSEIILDHESGNLSKSPAR